MNKIKLKHFFIFFVCASAGLFKAAVSAVRVAGNHTR